MTVLVAANASPHGGAALRTGIAEAARRHLPLALLVLDPGETLPDELAGPLAELPEGLAQPSVAFRAEADEPSDAILDTVEALPATLVVIGARKRTSQGTFVMGTTTQRVLLDAPVPVLVVKDVYEATEDR